MDCRCPNRHNRRDKAARGMRLAEKRCPATSPSIFRGIWRGRQHALFRHHVDGAWRDVTVAEVAAARPPLAGGVPARAVRGGRPDRDLRPELRQLGRHRHRRAGHGAGRRPALRRRQRREHRVVRGDGRGAPARRREFPGCRGAREVRRSGAPAAAARRAAAGRGRDRRDRSRRFFPSRRRNSPWTNSRTTRWPRFASPREPPAGRRA